MNRVALSFEFFPPKTDEQKQLLAKTIPRLKAFMPEYVSCTFGAGGSTLDYTVDTISLLRQTHDLDAAPHLSCMGGTRTEIKKLLQTYVDLGCKRIVALRGDMPSGMAASGDFSYANELVSFIRREFGSHFHIEVGAYPEIHPQAETAHQDLHYFAQKVQAGADGAITQYFYNADAYFRFVEDVERLGIDVPIVPGIMPIANFGQLKRFSDGCGAEIPRWLSKRMLSLGDDAEAIRAYGADVVAELCEQLMDGGVTALHFYTLNRARATCDVLDRLGITTTLPVV